MAVYKYMIPTMGIDLQPKKVEIVNITNQQITYIDERGSKARVLKHRNFHDTFEEVKNELIKRAELRVRLYKASLSGAQLALKLVQDMKEEN